MKYEIRKFTKKYAKVITENVRKEIDSLEMALKHLETDLKNYRTSQKYLDCKSKLDEIYSKKADRVRIRSKCDWYESGEKPNKFSLNLEKARAFQGLIRALVKNEKGISGPIEINTELQDFYKKLVTNNLSISRQNVDSLLEDLPVPKLQEEQVIKCNVEVTGSELLKSSKSMKNDKSPGNDGLTKEFYETFWEEIKIPFSNSIRKPFLTEELSTSEKQAAIKLIEKKSNKILIKNWRPISLSNVDSKLISKSL